MYRLYNDTEIFLDENNQRITITRGYWNFIQVSITYGDSQDKDRIVEFFFQLGENGRLEEKELEKEYIEQFEQLVHSGFIYRDDKEGIEKIGRVLVFTDMCDYMTGRINDVGMEKHTDIRTTEWLAREILDGRTFSDVKQDPLLKMQIQQKMKDLLEGKSLLVFCLSHADDDLCQLVNYLCREKEILYGVIDKEFAYLFGTKMKYTGCYDCFSKRMRARMKMEPIRSTKIRRKEACIEDEYRYVADYMTTLLLKNVKEFREAGAMPIMGRIAAIYTRTLEVRYENLLRLSFCNTCGYIGAMQNKERNLQLKNLLMSEEFGYEG